MSTKVKLIIAAIIILITIVSVAGILIYIDHLNDKISDISVTVSEQQNEISSLNCQIESLENNIDSFRETINITNKYISNMEKVKEDEINKKEEIYQTIINDDSAKEWYNEEIPASISNLLRSNDWLCEDSNRNTD